MHYLVLRAHVDVDDLFFPFGHALGAFLKYLRLTFQSIEIAFYGVVTVRAIICERVASSSLSLFS